MGVMNAWVASISNAGEPPALAVHKVFGYSDSIYRSLGSVCNPSRDNNQPYVGAIPAILRFATPGVWPVPYVPGWLTAHSLLRNAPTKIAWLLTAWSLEMTPFYPFADVPQDENLVFMFKSSYGCDVGYGKMADWTQPHNVPVMAIRPVFDPAALTISSDGIARYEDAIAAIVSGTEADISDEIEALASSNPFLATDEGEDDYEFDVEYDDEDDDEY